MRALALSALALGTAASAQDVRILPEARGAEPPLAIVPRDCGRGADMAVPLSPDVQPVPMPDLGLDGPEPVPMPNLCAEDADLTAGADLGRLRNRPRLYRFRDAPGRPNGFRAPDPFELRERWLPYPDLHGPPPRLWLDRLPRPDVEVPDQRRQLPPVAPPVDRP
jgi:hypothetical protein